MNMTWLWELRQEPQELVRFEEGNDSKLQDIVETVAHDRETHDQTTVEENQRTGESVGSGECHG